jgi:hypothetical protein
MCRWRLSRGAPLSVSVNTGVAAECGPLDQQAARGAITVPHAARVFGSDWHRTAVTTAILGALGVGLLALPTPLGLSSAAACVTGIKPRAARSAACQSDYAGPELGNRLVSTVLLTGASRPSQRRRSSGRSAGRAGWWRISLSSPPRCRWRKPWRAVAPLPGWLTCWYRPHRPLPSIPCSSPPCCS